MCPHLIHRLVSLAVSMCFAVSLGQAQQPMLAGSAAVDANGVRHTVDSRSTRRAPWGVDLVKYVPPDYPYEARRSQRQGAGLFRLHLDLATGKVTKVTILKSTGEVTLDNSALWAFRRWQMKPGRWRELDVPMVFSMSPPGPQFLPRNSAPQPKRTKR